MTLTKLAKLAHVSVSTASKAFSMSNEVNEQTRKEIFDIAKEYGCFKKFYNAKYPKYVIAVICPEFRGTYYSNCVALIQKQLEEKNCEVCFATTNFSHETEKNILNYYHNYSNVDGIIIIDSITKIENDFELPIVFINPQAEQEEGVTITVNYTEALADAIAHLKQAGKEPIGFIGETYTAKKLETFKELYPEYSQDYIAITAERFEKGGFEAAKDLISKDKLPKSIICAYDTMAIGVLDCLYKNKKTIRETVSVIGMNNISLAEYLNPSLSSIDFCFTEKSEYATNTIISLLNGKEAYTNKEFTAKLILRDSSN